MCKLKSAIILKDRIFMPDYDSHSKMLDELSIVDDFIGASKKFVRVELSPKDGDVFSDIDGWFFNIDQDIRPEWFMEDEWRPKMVEAVKVWAKTHIHIGVDGLIIDTGENHYIKDCHNVEVCGNGTVKYVCGNGTVNKVCGNGTVKYVYDNGTVNEVCDNGTVNEVCDNGTVKCVCGNGTVNKVCGNGTVKYVCGNGTVKYVCGNGTVKYVCGNGTVNEVCDNGTVNKVCGNGTVASSPYSEWKNAVGLILAENATFKDNYGKKIYQSGDYQLIAVNSVEKIGDRKEN